MNCIRAVVRCFVTAFRLLFCLAGKSPKAPAANRLWLPDAEEPVFGFRNSLGELVGKPEPIALVDAVHFSHKGAELATPEDVEAAPPRVVLCSTPLAACEGGAITSGRPIVMRAIDLGTPPPAPCTPRADAEVRPADRLPAKEAYNLFFFSPRRLAYGTPVLSPRSSRLLHMPGSTAGPRPEKEASSPAPASPASEGETSVGGDASESDFRIRPLRLIETDTSSLSSIKNMLIL